MGHVRCARPARPRPPSPQKPPKAAALLAAMDGTPYCGSRRRRGYGAGSARSGPAGIANNGDRIFEQSAKVTSPDTTRCFADRCPTGMPILPIAILISCIQTSPGVRILRENPTLETGRRFHDEAFDLSKEEFAKHFKTKYPGEDPPIWISAELWDFGAMSMLYSGMRVPDQTDVAKFSNVSSFKVMSSCLRAINVARNVCATTAGFGTSLV